MEPVSGGRCLPARALLAGILLAVAPLARADWAREYDLGMRAVEQGDWAEAERRMRAAIADEDEASARKRFQGQRFDRYVPQWYAGLAAYRQGDCTRALAYWNDAGSRRVVAAIAELASQQAKLGGECETRLASAKAPPATSTATDAPAAPASAAAPPPAAARPGDRRSGAADPAVAQRTPAQQTPARAAPAPAAKPPPARATPPREAAAETARRVAAPAVLRTALQAWLSGRYDELARSEPAPTLDARARSQILLLRAAARFVQAELAGNEAGLDAARADVRAARQAAAVRPDQALFPPRFRAFVAAIR